MIRINMSTNEDAAEIPWKRQKVCSLLCKSFQFVHSFIFHDMHFQELSEFPICCMSLKSLVSQRRGHFHLIFRNSLKYPDVLRWTPPAGIRELSWRDWLLGWALNGGPLEGLTTQGRGAAAECRESTHQSQNLGELVQLSLNRNSLRESEDITEREIMYRIASLPSTCTVVYPVMSPFPQTPGNYSYFYRLLGSEFSRMFYHWNHTVCSLFVLASST